MRNYIDPSDLYGLGSNDLINEACAEGTSSVCVSAGFCNDDGDKVWRDLGEEMVGILPYWTRTELGDAELLTGSLTFGGEDSDERYEPEPTLWEGDVPIEIFDSPNWDHIVGLSNARNKWLEMILGRIRNIDNVRSFRKAMGFVKFQAVASRLRKEGKTRNTDGKPLPIGLDYNRYAVAMNSLLLWGVTKGFIEPEKAKTVKVQTWPSTQAQEPTDALDGPRVGFFVAEQQAMEETWDELPYESNLLSQPWHSPNYDPTQRLYFRMSNEEIEAWLAS